jgi:hypothetical protein
MFIRVITALASLYCAAAVAGPINVAGGPKGAGLDGIVSDWSAWGEPEMTSACLEDLTPGAFDGYQIGAVTRTRLILQIPTFGGDPLPTDETEPTGYDLTESDEQEFGCDWVDEEGPDVPAANETVYTDLRVRAETSSPAPNLEGIGSFRLTCEYSHYAYDDPIVFPGSSGASHLHNFFGNTSTDAFTTTSSLSAANSTTCAGGVANESAYWIPAMVGQGGVIIVPTNLVVYYKTSHNASQVEGLRETIIWPPEGHRQIVGFATATAPPIPWEAVHAFYCESGPDAEAQVPYIPECPEGTSITGIVYAMECWDGVNLDSPNHRSHMTRAPGYDWCPASHPVQLPIVSVNIHWTVPMGQNSGFWKLSSDLSYTPGYESGGYSMHADFWFNWSDPTTVTGGLTVPQTILTNCLHTPLDCHANLLGNGQEVYQE